VVHEVLKAERVTKVMWGPRVPLEPKDPEALRVSAVVKALRDP